MGGVDTAVGPEGGGRSPAAIRSALVEDDESIAEFIKAALTSRGHQVTVFGDAETAWAAHLASAFELMVLDWMLPGMDGLELCRRVRGRPGGEAAAVLVVTGRDQRADLEAVLQAGASDYVAKPVELRELLTRIAVAEHRIEETRRRMRAEAELQASEQRTRALLEAIPDTMLRVSLDGRVVACHAPLPCGFAGQGGSAVAPGTLAELVPAEAASWCLELIETARRTQTPQLTEFLVSGPAGGQYLEARFVSCGEDEVLIILRDVTERRRIEKGLLQASRMVSMGTLAASVAHEISEPLSNIIAKLELLKQELLAAAANGVCAPLVRESRESAERVDRVVRGLRAFARARGEELVPVDVHRAIEAALELSRSRMGSSVRLVRNFGELQPVMADESRLCQVFLCVLTNAAEALTGGEEGPNEIEISTWASGGQVEVEIRDTGKGMSAETQSRVFEPFFSTKPSGASIGLGLTISQGIVQELGGEIRVESAPGEGSCFRVSLPALDGAGTLPAGVRGDHTVAFHRGLRVLLIDDDPLVLTGLRRLLQGCKVAVARGGREALEQCKESWFDLILCDVMMPGRSGLQVYQDLRRERPDLAMRFVFMTGTSDAEVMLQLHKSTRPWVQKPFDRHEVMDLLRELHLKASAGRVEEN